MAVGFLCLCFAVKPTSAAPAYALSFDGAGSYVDTQVGVIPASGDFTVECWAICPTGTQLPREILSQGSSGNAFYIGPDNAGWLRLGDTWLDPGVPFPFGAWHHFAVVKSSTNTVFYLDGWTRAVKDSAITNPLASTALRLGRQYGAIGEYWLGMIDEVRVWNLARSAAEIQSCMNRVLVGAETGLVAYWPLDDGSGATAADATGHGYSGYLSNGVAWSDSPAPVGAPPVVTAVPDQVIAQGAATDLIAFTVSDPDTPLDGVTVTASSDNPVLVPNTGQALVLGGSGADRMLQVVPVPEHSGSATITVAAWDGTAMGDSRFTLTVLPGADQPILQFTAGEVASGQSLRFRFEDLGGGATNYGLDFLPDLSSESRWTNASNVTITPLTPGVFQVDITPPPRAQGFFRLKGFRLFWASFDAADVTLDEGAGVISPVIVFNGPFSGTVHYTVGGTAGPDDHTAVSGQVQVNGTTAAIPIALRDDDQIGSARTLILTLSAGPGFHLGSIRRTTVTIGEDDADWQGAFVVGRTSFGFQMRLRQREGRCAATFRNSEFSLFPTNELPVDLTLTADRFAATVAGIAVPASATSFDTPMRLTLQLEAANGQPNQTVNPKRVQGLVSLLSQAPALPHLNSTNYGTFLLVRTPGSMPTNQVELVPTP